MGRKNQVWKRNFEKLKAYHKEHGNFYVPIGWREDLHFALWVENIRKAPKHLPTELRKKLQSIGFTINSSSDWNIMFSRLKAFYKKHGHSYVPPHQEKFESLFDWTVNQRRAKSRLAPEQLKALDSLDFDWTISIQEELHWEEMFQQLVAFKKQHGHTKVPQSYKENKALGTWVSVQRWYKTMKRLRPEREDRLNAIGFLWKEDIARLLEEAWETKYNELVRYKKANGHIDRITIRHDNRELAVWMDTQIVYKEKLSPPRKKKLNVIGFKWDKGDYRGELWDEMYGRLKAYKKKHGHCQVTKTDDFKLYTWIIRHKTQRDIIRKERKRKLEQISINLYYDHKAENWESMYGLLKKYKKQHGHLHVTSSKSASTSVQRLYHWLQGQIYLKKHSQLSREREKRLQQLDLLWYLRNYERRWHQKLAEFIAFKKTGKGSYLSWDTPLRHWLYWQKKNFRRLPNEKKEALLKAGVLKYLDNAGTRHAPYRPDLSGRKEKKPA